MTLADPIAVLSVYFNDPSLSCLQTSFVLSYLNDLLLHVDGVGDGGPIGPGLRVLPGLAATSQGQYLLRQVLTL